MQRRNEIHEDRLPLQLRFMTSMLRQNSDSDRNYDAAFDGKKVKFLEDRDEAEQKELRDYEFNRSSVNDNKDINSSNEISSEENHNLPGRQSGSVQWRRDRNEFGGTLEEIVATCVIELKSVNCDENEFLALLIRVLGRIVSYPTNPKYRCLKIGNRDSRAAQLVSSPAGKLLNRVGFQQKGSGDSSELVLECSTNEINTVHSLLLQYAKDNNVSELSSHPPSSVKVNKKKPDPNNECEQVEASSSDSCGRRNNDDEKKRSFEECLRSEFERVLSSNPSLSPNEAAAEALKRLSVKDTQHV